MGFGYGRTTAHNEPAKSRETGARARKVFSNDMVAHVWAARSQTFGQSNNGNFYFKGDSLFSYGKHFLCGFLFAMPKGEPVALLSGESYSVSTSGHMSDARHAVRHLTRYEVPELTKLADALPTLAKYAGKPEAFRRAVADWQDSRYHRDNADWHAASALRDVRAWLGAFDITEDSEVTSRGHTWTSEGNKAAVQFICKAAGITAKEIAKIQAERRKKIADAKAAEAEREARQLLWEAEKCAAMSDSDWLEGLPRDGHRQWSPAEEGTPRYRMDSKPWELRAAEEYGRKLFRWHKAAKANGLTEAAAKLAERRKAYRLHLAGRNERILKAYRHEAAAALAAWRRNPGKLRWRGSAGTSINIGFYSERTRRIVERVETANYFAANVAKARAYLEQGEGERPGLSELAEDSPEYAAIQAEIRAENQAAESLFLAWKAGESSELPDKRVFLSGYGGTPFATAYEEIAEAERKAAAAKRIAEEREAREAWLAGESGYWRGSDESGGAYMRIRGDSLETSQGASVPLAHAIRVFQFVKLCRARGEGWKRNGKTIRVGHFQVDSIDPDGSFKAGCHCFSWPEIERVAALAGVAEAEPSAEAVETREGVN